jgi:S-adenosylmethionine:tRNA ribosyltransferase-isomerase
MRAATRPAPRLSRLLVIDAHGRLSHHRRDEFRRFVWRNDVVVANDAATLPASLTGLHDRTHQPIEVRLAGRRSLAPDEVTSFTAVVFGDGDYHTPTERRLPPPRLQPGDLLTLGRLRARIDALLGGHARLVALRFEETAARVWEGLARHGRPIQYAYVPEPLAIWDTWTVAAGLPAAFEPPSAGFLLDWATIDAIRTQGATFATLTHAAGISSTGDEELDRLLPFDEPYVIPHATVEAIARSKRDGGRVIAIGTTVVRALEHAARSAGTVEPGPGIATGRIGAATPPRIVDAIVSGMHEKGSSHYELLRAFASDDDLERMTAAAEREDYASHEFGDFTLISRKRDLAQGGAHGGTETDLTQRREVAEAR